MYQVLYQNEPLLKSKYFLIGVLSVFVLCIHLYTNIFASYGIFRDEFYYLACARHLSLGYVDQPPFSIYVLAIINFIIGHSLFAIRLLPAILSALNVLIICLIVDEIGGGKFAIFLAGLAFIVAPIFLGMYTIYSMNSIDIFLWTMAAYIIVIMLNRREQKHWIGLGIVIGIGLLNKIGVLWLAFGLFAGLLLTKERAQLKTKWPYISAVIALILFSPFIIWNITHDFAHLEFIRNATSQKYSGLNAIDFIKGQFLILNPISAVVWIAGLYYFFFDENGKRFKILGIIYVVTFLILIINGHSKSEYLAAAYPMLFAGGSILIEKIVKNKYLHWVKFVLPILMLSLGVIAAPFALPILPVENFIAYSHMLGRKPSSSENKKLSELPQFYADMFGWQNMAQTISDVYLSIPKNERQEVVIFASNYGEAGALEYYSKKFPMPRIISPHNSYWYWGKDIKGFNAAIVIGYSFQDVKQSCKNVIQLAVIKNIYCMPYENNLPVFYATDFKYSFSRIWNSSKSFQ